MIFILHTSYGMCFFFVSWCSIFIALKSEKKVFTMNKHRYKLKTMFVKGAPSFNVVCKLHVFMYVCVCVWCRIRCRSRSFHGKFIRNTACIIYFLVNAPHVCNAESTIDKSKSSNNVLLSRKNVLNCTVAHNT